MWSELKHSLSSLSPSNDELKPLISTTGCFTLFGRPDNLFLTVLLRPSISIQPCQTVSIGIQQWVMVGYTPRGVIEYMKNN